MQNKETRAMDKAIEKLDKEIAKWEKKEATARKKWTLGHERCNAAGQYLDEITRQIAETKRIPKRFYSQKRIKALEIREGWPEISKQLTLDRDNARAQIARLKEKKSDLSGSLKALRVQITKMQEENDEKIRFTENLIEAQRQAMENTREFFKLNYYDHLITPEGKPRSQITITHSNGLSRVTAFGIPMPTIRADLAEDATRKIREFQDRFMQVQDEDAVFMIDLTSQILIQKVSFKQGPALGLFLRANIPETYPELIEAQELIKSSLSMENTRFQVRLQKRESITEPFRTVKKTPY